MEARWDSYETFCMLVRGDKGKLRRPPTRPGFPWRFDICWSDVGPIYGLRVVMLADRSFTVIPVQPLDEIQLLLNELFALHLTFRAELHKCWIYRYDYWQCSMRLLSGFI